MEQTRKQLANMIVSNNAQKKGEKIHRQKNISNFVKMYMGSCDTTTKKREGKLDKKVGGT